MHFSVQVIQETVITSIDNWVYQFVKGKLKHKKDDVEAVEKILFTRRLTVSDLRQALK